MNRIVLATNNVHKISEISHMMAGLPIMILTKKDFADFPDVEETGRTLEDNAVLKAKVIYEYCGIPSLADDSGLEVTALGGIPGVNSARYAGPGCTFDDNNRKLLEAMEGIPDENRQAVFRCVVAVEFGENDIEIVQGRVEGRITTETRGDSGFGYDPVFYFPPYDKTFAEIPPEEKNKISHRAIALARARELLISRFELKDIAR